MSAPVPILPLIPIPRISGSPAAKEDSILNVPVRANCLS